MRLLRPFLSSAACLVAAFALSGCMTVDGLGGYPGGTAYPGGSTPYPGSPSYPPAQYGQAIIGQVEAVDHANGRFMLRGEGGYGAAQERVEIHYDRSTQAVYQGQAASPAGLEPGDRIRVQVAQSNGRWWAQGIEVLQDVRAGGGSPVYGSTLGGAVTGIDTRNRILAFTRGGYSGSNERVRYDAQTWVEYRGQRYRVEQLERGDVIRIEGRVMGNGEFLAERIIVETSVRER